MSFSNRGPASYSSALRGEEIEVNQADLEKYISTSAGQARGAERLRGKRIFQANDRPGWNPEPGIGDLYTGYHSWLTGEKERVRMHEDYKTLSKERPGREATILGGNQLSSMNQTILGGTYG
jgi:hypothetical protein